MQDQPATTKGFNARSQAHLPETQRKTLFLWVKTMMTCMIEPVHGMYQP
jgi:hypothetical protein